MAGIDLLAFIVLRSLLGISVQPPQTSYMKSEASPNPPSCGQQCRPAWLTLSQHWVNCESSLTAKAVNHRRQLPNPALDLRHLRATCSNFLCFVDQMDNTLLVKPNTALAGKERGSRTQLQKQEAEHRMADFELRGKKLVAAHPVSG